MPDYLFRRNGKIVGVAHDEGTPEEARQRAIEATEALGDRRADDLRHATVEIDSTPWNDEARQRLLIRIFKKRGRNDQRG